VCDLFFGSTAAAVKNLAEQDIFLLTPSDIQILNRVDCLCCGKTGVLTGKIATVTEIVTVDFHLTVGGKAGRRRGSFPGRPSGERVCLPADQYAAGDCRLM
jgi:magnesium-transporting ATPase (P-type)